MKELKSPDKVVQQMTRNGAVEINKTTGGAERISARELDVSHDTNSAELVGGIADRILSERRAHKKKAVRKANAKIFKQNQRSPETSRLHFSDAERTDPALAKSIKKSDRAADRYDKAQARIPKEKVLSIERSTDAPKGKQKPEAMRPVFSEKGRLTDIQRVKGEPTGKPSTRLIFRERDKPPNGKLTHILDRPKNETASAVHGEVKKYEGDNTGVKAAHSTEKAAEKAVRITGDIHNRLKFEPQRKLFKAKEKAIKTNVNALYKRDLQIKPELEKAGDMVQQAAKFAVKNSKAIVIIGGGLLLLMVLLSGISSCAGMFGGGFTGVIGTSYTAEDADIIGANDDYSALENSLQQRINNIPSDYPGYNEYNYSLDAIGHDPFALTSYLTAKYNAYTQAAVNGDLAGILAQQYRLTLTPVTEIRYRTETRTGTTTYTDPETGDTYEEKYEYEVQVPYYYYILNVSLVNNTLDSVALSTLTPEQYEMYLVYMETKGNKPELFP